MFVNEETNIKLCNIESMCRMLIENINDIKSNGLDSYSNPVMASSRRISLELYKRTSVFKEDVSKLTK